jgi:hypothetical protein
VSKSVPDHANSYKTHRCELNVRLIWAYKIFISSTMDDLKKEREDIALEVFLSQNFPIIAERVINVIDSPRGTLEKLVDECDGYIGVFHRRWGYVPEEVNPNKLSIAAIEYERAKKRNIPLLLLISDYEKDEELAKFVKRISDMKEGNWRVKYIDSSDLIKKVIRGIPTLIEGIKIRQQETRHPSPPKLEIFPSISSPNEAVEVNLEDVSEETIKKYATVITTSSNADVKNVAWRYLGKLAENKRIWNFPIVWSLLDGELLATTPTESFGDALSILGWMLRNSKSELSGNNSTSNKVREHYLHKFKEILGSNNDAWDNYDRVDVKEILKSITEPDERCEIWWEAWKKCAKGIEDTNQYTSLTQFISTELENSSTECKDFIRNELIDIIKNDQPPYFAKRAKNLHDFLN